MKSPTQFKDKLKARGLMLAKRGCRRKRPPPSPASSRSSRWTRRKRRSRFSPQAQLVEKLAPCTIGMEACCGAHHLGRQFAALGHTVRLMSPEYVSATSRRRRTTTGTPKELRRPRPGRRCVSSRLRAKNSLISSRSTARETVSLADVPLSSISCGQFFSSAAWLFPKAEQGWIDGCGKNCQTRAA